VREEMSYETFNWVSFYFFIVLGLLLFFQTYINLVLKKITKFGIDEMALLYIRILRGKSVVDRARKLLSKEPKRIQLFGFVALISDFASIYEAIYWYGLYLVAR
jgi:hypothetical protein